MESDPHIVILAGGTGGAMKSRQPKALMPVLFRPMIHYVLEAASALPHRSLTAVVSGEEEEFRRQCAAWPGTSFVRHEGEGTGVAMRAARAVLDGRPGPVLVLSADVIMLEPASLRRLLDRHEHERAACTIGATTLAAPDGYGRIIRHIDGRVADVRESADCSAIERAINEVNAGIYCFDSAELLSALAELGERGGRLHLPDAVKVLVARGRKAVSYSFGDPAEVAGIDDRVGLWRVETLVQERVNAALMRRGVSLQDPRSAWIDPRCRIAEDVRIEAGVVLVNSSIEAGAVIESGCRVVDSSVGADTRLLQGSYVEGSRIGASCSIGPYARLRPVCRLAAGVKVGNFVELKQATLGPGTKASHLSYIGDAEIGRDVNVGCGFITCNYDGGPVKNRTVIEDEVFIGSDCQAVAPVRIGRGSYVAAGSTVTDEVPEESLAIARSRQTTKPGYARKYRRPRAGGSRKAASKTRQEDLSKI